VIKIISVIAAISILLAALAVQALAADARAPVTKPPNVASPPTYAAPPPPTTGGIGARTGSPPGGVRTAPAEVSALTENGCVSMGGQINRDSKECNDQGYFSCKIVVAGIAQWLCIDNK
jgi:hypothetical protein